MTKIDKEIFFYYGSYISNIYKRKNFLRCSLCHGKRHKQAFQRKVNPTDLQAHEEMLKLTSNQRNINENDSEISLLDSLNWPKNQKVEQYQVLAVT